jgi:catechol 2,3-dioxygenase-like lactoylglutathione lyase family enzyme
MALTDGSAWATIAVSDLNRAKNFYEGTLGFKASHEDPNMGILYDAGDGTKFLVYPSQFAGTSQSTCVTFDVGDFDVTMKDLREKGITFEEYDLPYMKTVDGVAEFAGMKGAWFKDPDGNILAIGQMPA